MFANDKNVETIGLMVEALRRYLSLQAKLWKLIGIEKTVRICTVVLMLVVFLIMSIFAVMFVSMAAACALEQSIGMVGALLTVAGVHIVLFLTFFLLRKPLIERPLVKLLMSIFK